MSIHKIIAFSIQNHWLVITILVVSQFIGGKLMTGDFPLTLPISMYPLNRQLHEFLGTLLLLGALTLAAEKIYLIYLRRRR